jgi:hypothetical protein
MKKSSKNFINLKNNNSHKKIYDLTGHKFRKQNK